MNPLLASLLDRRFVIISGKGGVGRTTVAAALAHSAAGLGKRVLIAQANAPERLGGLLGKPGPVGPKVVALTDRISAVNMTPKTAIHEYALMVLKFEFAYRAIFENRAVRGFVGAIPGLDGYAMLGKAWYHTTEMVEGRPRWDLVIFDGPASGHIVSLLRMPQNVLKAMPHGPLSKEARLAHELLSDRARSALVIVTLAKELPVREATQLAHAAQERLDVALGPMVVNALPPPRFSDPGMCNVLEKIDGPTGDQSLDDTLKMAHAMRTQRLVADRMLARLREDPGLPLFELPRLSTVDMGPHEIERLARIMETAPA